MPWDVMNNMRHGCQMKMYRGRKFNFVASEHWLYPVCCLRRHTFPFSKSIGKEYSNESGAKASVCETPKTDQILSQIGKVCARNEASCHHRKSTARFSIPFPTTTQTPPTVRFNTTSLRIAVSKREQDPIITDTWSCSVRAHIDSRTCSIRCTNLMFIKMNIFAGRVYQMYGFCDNIKRAQRLNAISWIVSLLGGNANLFPVSARRLYFKK